MSRHKKYEIEVGKIYESNNCGDYLVLNDDKKGKRKGYNIRFINTGYEKWVRNKQVVMGSVYDNNVSNNLFLGRVFNSNIHGKFMLVGIGYKMNNTKKYNRKYYVIKFLNTGNQQSEQKHHMWTGEVRDKFFDDISIGYEYQSDNQKVTVIAKSRINNHYIVKGHENNAIWHCDFYDIKRNKFNDCLSKNNFGAISGYIKYYDNSYGDIYKALTSRWYDMMRRCYLKSSISYKYYGAKGVTVCDRWHRLDNFIFDVVTIDGYNEELILSNYKMDLDKDKLQYNLPHDKRVYSKDTCLWLTRKENNKYVSNKKIEIN